MKLIKNNKMLEIIIFLLFISGLLLPFIPKFFDLSFFVIPQSINLNNFGQFGDFIGGISGSLWALAGVLLFYLALKEQRKDIQINQKALNAQIQSLNQQIEEFKLQRNELEQTRKVFIEQSETLKIQRFENTFFQLLTLQQELVDNLRFDHPEYTESEILSKKLYTRNNVFSKSVEILKGNFQKDIFDESNWKSTEPKSYKEAYERIGRRYKEFYLITTKQSLSHYFRNLYHIFKFIYLSELVEDKRKQFYASIVRAQLSSDELFLILYNSLIDGLGKPNFLFLIRFFDIMQNFDFELISRFKYHKDIFDREKENAKSTFSK